MVQTVNEYAAAVASGTPTPGGGSVIATVAALAAGLAEMVCHLTLARPLEPRIAETLSDTRRTAANLRLRLLELAGEDERAYGAYRDAAGLPRTSPEEREVRRIALETALMTSAAVPLEVASHCVEVLAVIETVAAFGTKHAHADIFTSLRLTSAALKSALDMVRANTDLMHDREKAARVDRDADDLRVRGEQATSAVLLAIERRSEGKPV